VSLAGLSLVIISLIPSKNGCVACLVNVAKAL
jgi:hypothetical protein